jgi:flagellar biosynthesis protein FliR
LEVLGELQVRADWLLGALFSTLRCGAATAFIPVFGVTNVPPLVRTLWIVALAVTLHGVATPVAPGMATNGVSLVLAGLSELLIGMSLAFGLLTAYAATQLAGRALDVQIGFSAATVLNPATRSFGSLLGTLFGMVAMIVFLSMDGHHVLIRALSLSFSVYPPGQFGFVPELAPLLSQSSAMFSFGLALAGPVMLALLLADVTMAVMARSMPQLNVFLLSFAIKVVLGLIGLAVAIPLAGGLLESLFGSVFVFWDELLGGA